MTIHNGLELNKRKYLKRKSGRRKRLYVPPAPPKCRHRTRCYNGVGILFFERKFLGIPVTDSFTSLPPQRSGTKTMLSYAVMNRGDQPVSVRLEISPNNLDYSRDMDEIVPPREMKVLVPNRFLKWTRVSAASGDSEASGAIRHTGKIDVYVQAQSLGIR